MRLLEDSGAKSFFIRALTGDIVKTKRRHGEDRGKTPSELKFLNKKSKLVYADKHAAHSDNVPGGLHPARLESD